MSGRKGVPAFAQARDGAVEGALGAPDPPLRPVEPGGVGSAGGGDRTGPRGGRRPQARTQSQVGDAVDRAGADVAQRSGGTGVGAADAPRGGGLTRRGGAALTERPPARGGGPAE